MLPKLPDSLLHCSFSFVLINVFDSLCTMIIIDYLLHPFVGCMIQWLLCIDNGKRPLSGQLTFQCINPHYCYGWGICLDQSAHLCNIRVDSHWYEFKWSPPLNLCWCLPFWLVLFATGIRAPSHVNALCAAVLANALDKTNSAALKYTPLGPEHISMNAVAHFRNEECNTFSPIFRLPTELLLNVLYFVVSDEHGLESLIACSHVCCILQTITIQSPCLWYHAMDMGAPESCVLIALARCDNLVFFGLILAILTYLYIHYFCGLYKHVSLSPVPVWS